MIKHLKVIAISTITLLAFSPLLFGKTDVLFSPRGKIGNAITDAINSSKNSIDIAIFIFTSGDFAEALLTAKDRGVNVRIVIDEKQGKKEHPILQFLRDEGFNMQYLKGNVGGFMHNSFAIFDNKLVITGSYNWTEYAEKFNYENVIVTDEPNVVAQFQDEFENLFGKSVKGIEIASKSTPLKHKQALETSGKLNVNIESTSQVETKEKVGGPGLDPKKQKTKTSFESHEDFLDISFEEFDDIFGAESSIPKKEKKELWKKRFKGKFVKWRGTVRYKGVSLYDWNKVGVSHKSKDGADVQIKFSWQQKAKVKMLKIGTTVTYIGRLDSLRGLTSPYKLIDCDVVGK